VNKEKRFILYGIDNLNQISAEISNLLKNSLDDFDLKLILSEALSNAFIHGNKKDKSKPIYLCFTLKGNLIKFEIKDAGAASGEFIIPDEISEENILNDHGRGLFLLKCFTDSIEFKNNTLILTKKIS
jgi:serine/threonine-protein kinase RsbW